MPCGDNSFNFEKIVFERVENTKLKGYCRKLRFYLTAEIVLKGNCNYRQSFI